MLRSFQVFCKQKGAKVLQLQEDINVHCYHCTFVYKSVSQFFEILIFSQNVWENVHYVPEINKRLLSPEQNKSRTLFCRRKTAEGNNAKINFSPNIPCTFLLFKASAFLQSFFPRYFLFGQVLRMSVFLNCKY